MINQDKASQYLRKITVQINKERAKNNLKNSLHIHWWDKGKCKICKEIYIREDNEEYKSLPEKMFKCLGNHCKNKEFLTTKNNRICDICLTYPEY